MVWTPHKRIIAIVGPTASGKSEVAQCVAELADGEVVGADSMQVYRGMDIGTGKVPLSEMRIPHHCIDLADPGEPFSAALYQEHARRAFEDIDSRGKRIVLCGGTGFYVRAALDDYRFPAGEQVGNPVRDRWNAYALEKGNHALWTELAASDPESAAIIPENDVKRIVRAFELLEEGTSYAQQKEKLAHIAQWAPAGLYGLLVDPERLRARIDARVDGMVEAGLVNEVEDLLNAGLRTAVTAREAIGYKEIVDALEGRCTLDEAIEAIKLATRRYAKRQRTWFRNDKRVVWIDANERTAQEIAFDVMRCEEHSAKSEEDDS